MVKGLEGKRVEAILIEDGKIVPKGTQGTVQFIDDIGTIFVRWDNGSSLGIVPQVDDYKLLG